MICKFHKPTQNNLVWTQFTVTSTNAWRRSHEHDPKTFLSSLGQRKTVLWSDESKFDILFWKTWTPHPPNLREDPACYQRSVQKPPPLTVRGLISAYRTGSLHIWKRYVSLLERHIFLSSHAFFREGFAYFRKMRLKLILHVLKRLSPGA